ncbi:heavy metal translocating P-type ATPase [Chloroflexota bacterium]
MDKKAKDNNMHGGHMDHTADNGPESADAQMDHNDHAAHEGHMMGGGPDEHSEHTESGSHGAQMDHEGHLMEAEHGEHKIHTTAAAHGEHNGHSASGSQGDHAAHVDHTGYEDMFRKRFWVSLVLSIPVLLYSPTVQSWFGFTMPAFPGSQLIVPVLSIFIFFYGGSPFLKMAVPEVKTRKPGMMTLISLAISVAFIYSLGAMFLPTEASFFWELVTLIDIMLLGHWLEMRSIRQASGALNELAKLMPDTAEKIEEDGSTHEIPTSDLKGNDLVLIRPGASIPVDGIIVEGESDVNESMITGESVPVKKVTEAEVIAGTINGSGSLRVRVTATGDDTALAGIMRLVEQAQMSKSRTQLLADKAAGWLFYIAVGAAILTAIVWTAAIGFNSEVIARVATVLVIACPHALGLAIPLVVSITTSMGAKNGILVRDRIAMEKARDIDVVIFDKTGTLTKGEFGVVATQTIDSWEKVKALALAAAIEGDSEHMIAQGIRRSAEEERLELPAVSEFEAIKGRGVHAVSDGHKVYMGGPRLLEMLNLDIPASISDFTAQSNEKDQSVVYLIQDDQLVTVFALADVIRPESRQAIKDLHEMGVEVAMLTGDSKAVAKTVAEELDIDTYFAEVLPEHKDQKVAQLQEEGKLVAMVGDGVNDAPALTRADIGIAIGSGTDVAIESAGIILVRSDPTDIVTIMRLSRASYRKMKQNLIWATGYNVIAIPLAAGILAPIGFLLSPAIGALFMSLSTVIVAINAQLLHGYKLKPQT